MGHCSQSSDGVAGCSHAVNEHLARESHACLAARSASSLAGHARSRRQPSAPGWHRSQEHARTMCQSETRRASTTRSSFSSRIASAERAQGPKALAAAAESARPHPARPNPAAHPSWPSPTRSHHPPEIQLSPSCHEVRERSCSAWQ